MSRACGRRARALGVLAIVGAAVLSACGGLPVHSSVRIERSLPNDAGVLLEPARVLPPGPATGASPTEIVDGFLAAQADADGDYAVARSFLTPDASWPVSGTITTYSTAAAVGGAVTGPASPATSAPPTGGAHTGATKRPTPLPTVTRSGPPVDGSTTVVRTTLQLAASLDPSGAYTPRAGAQVLPIRLRYASGQWRISDVGAGVLLTLKDLERSYEPETLWWLAPKGGLLIPDIRWFPIAPLSLPTSLVKALLAGPQGRLAGVVRSAIPTGTQLRGSATVIGSDALVDLDRTAATLTADQARAVLSQLVETLGEVPSVTGVRLTVEGQPLPIPGLPARVTVAYVGSADPDTQIGAAAYAPNLAAGVTKVGAGRRNVGVARFSSLDVEQVATSPDGSRAAVAAFTGDGGVRVYDATGTSGPTALGPPGPVSSLSYDAQGNLLVATPATLRIYNTARQSSAVVVDPVAGTSLGPIDRALVSRDGVRVALITGTAGARRLWLGVLRTESNGVHLAGLEQLAPALADVRSVSWADSADLVLLGSAPGHTDVELWQLALDGSALTSTVLAPTVVGVPQSITAMAGSPVLITAAPRVYERVVGGFRQLTGSTAPTYPG